MAEVKAKQEYTMPVKPAEKVQQNQLEKEKVSEPQTSVNKTNNAETVNISVVNGSQASAENLNADKNQQQVHKHHNTAQNFSEAKRKDNKSPVDQRMKGSKSNISKRTKTEKGSQRQNQVNRSMYDPISNAYSKTTFRFFNVYTGRSQAQPLNQIRGKKNRKEGQSAQPNNGENEESKMETQNPMVVNASSGDERDKEQHISMGQRSTSQGLAESGVRKNYKERQYSKFGVNQARTNRDSRTPDRSLFNESTSILSSLPGVSVHKVRQNRQKIELDVLKLHNRIQLLQQEEEKALKRIEETRQKAKQIIQTRQQNEERSKELSIMKQTDQLVKREKVEERSKEISTNIKEKQSLIAQRKILDAIAIKREAAKLKKKKEKMQSKYLKEAQRKKDMIRMASEINKERNEKLQHQKIAKSKRVKEDQMFDESVKISKKEKEARKLEVLEAEILKRLRDTHIKQQQAIEEIQQIFAKGGNNQGSIEESPSMCTNYSTSKIAQFAAATSTERSVAKDNKQQSPVKYENEKEIAKTSETKE